MNFRQLVIRNVMRSGRLYASYFFSSVFSIMVFFIFALIFFHPNYAKSMSASSETIAILANISLKVAQVLVLIMSFIFLWYAFTVFLKGRQYHFSIYLILGMPKRDLQRMVFGESMVIALLAILTGMSLGTLFSKLVLLISQNILAIDQTLPFYFPTKPALLTALVYLSLFLLLSFFTTMRLGNEDLTELSKAEVKPMKEPVTKWYLAFIGTLFLLMGYACVLYFTKFITTVQHNFFGGGVLLISGVLLTIVGTYLLYQQTSIYLLKFLRKQKNYYKGKSLLSISSLTYRLKQNGVMYFMITTVAAVSLVAIGVTMTLGGSEFGRSLNTSFAYVYDSPSNSVVHQKRVAHLERTIREAGYEPLLQKVYPLFLDTEDLDVNFNFAIPASIFNEMAAFTNQKKLHPKGQQVIKLATTNKEVIKIKQKKLNQKTFPMTFNLASEKKGVRTTYTYSTERYSIGDQPFLVVSDAFYAEIAEAQSLENSLYNGEEISNPPTYVIHFLEWSEDRELAAKLSKSLADEYDKAYKKMMLIDEKFTKIPEEKLTEEQEIELDEINEELFAYSSLYEAWRDARQANGMILFLSVLIGSVFFSFAACIIYFRLFGDLAQDGAYHYSLYILGVSQKTRHRLVTIEMFLMYFIPVLVAILHFSVAIYAFGLLTNLSVWTYFRNITFTYLLFQVLFFLVSRWRYIIQLERIAEINEH